MSVSKSVIEDFELTSGVLVTIQASQHGGIYVIFESRDQSYNQKMTLNEAFELQKKLNQVIVEARENGIL